MTLFVQSEKGFSVLFDVIYEDNAICMVNLMLENSGQEALGRYTEFTALQILSFNTNLGMAGYFAVNIRDA
jgi:hypothetical protein